MPAPPPPPSEPSWLRSRWAGVTSPFRWLGRWFYYLPRPVQVGLGLVLVLGTVAAVYYAPRFQKDRTVEREVAAGWREFEAAAKKTDLEAMTAALDRVLAARPGDPTAARRRAAIRARAADADDPELAAVFLNHHVRGDHLPEAAREAEKVLARFPMDWQARCVLVHHALQVAHDRELAARRLEELPDPEDPAAHVGPGGLLYAMRLSAAVGRDAGPLRAVIVRRLLPILRSGTAAAAPPAVQVQLIDCYLEPFADRDPPLGELAGYWAATGRLADAALSGAADAGDVAVLIELGSLGGRLRAALVLFRDGGQVPADRFDVLAKEVADRSRTAWRAVREKAPTRPEPYRALALDAVRERDFAAAMRLLQDGLAACGERAELLDLLIKYRSGLGGVAEGLDIAWAAAEKAGNDPAKWCLAANAAIAAGRHDRAIEACRNARQPPHEQHRWAAATEAALWLRSGDAPKALDALRPLGDVALRSDAILARLHGRALAKLPALPQLDAEFAAVEKSAPIAAAFLRGTLDAHLGRPQDITAITDWVIAKTTAALGTFPADTALRRILADALDRKAESTVAPDGSAARLPKWDADAVRAALRAFDAVPAAERSDIAALVAVATLELKGQNDAASALRTLAPIRAAEDDPTLPPAAIEILGAAFRGAGKTADALRVLRRSLGRPDPTPGCYIQLALTYHANHQPFEAEAALRLAEPRVNTPRERIELVAAKLHLQRENP